MWNELLSIADKVMILLKEGFYAVSLPRYTIPILLLLLGATCLMVVSKKYKNELWSLRSRIILILTIPFLIVNLTGFSMEHSKSSIIPSLNQKIEIDHLLNDVEVGSVIFLKQGVDFKHVQWQLRRKLPLIQKVFKKVTKKPLVITSTTEGIHEKNSLHYKGLAIDIRKNMTDRKARRIKRYLEFELGEGFNVHYGDRTHHNHFHVSYIGF
jgi:hypothetical protein